MTKIKFTDKYGPQEVRALSWKQPFASLMLHGKVETRTWDTKVRGWILICSSQKTYTKSQVEEISGSFQADRAMFTLGAERIKYKMYDGWAIQASKMECSQAIAIGYLSSTKLMDDYSSNPATISEIENKCFVKFRSGLWMHEYVDVQPIEPFAWKGQLGFKKLDQETIDKIVLL